MFAAIRTIIFSAVVLAVSFSEQAYAALEFPDSATATINRAELTIPAAAAMPYSLSCLQDIEQCPAAEKAVLIVPPKIFGPPADQIALGTPTLAPMAHSLFCVQYPHECEIKNVVEATPLEWTNERWRELVEVNARVNRSILPERNTLGLAAERWLIQPRAGDCNDYAVTKRHELLKKGWPSQALLLSEVITHSGEHHLILLVRMGSTDFVLDNLSASIRPWSKVPYRWFRVQTPWNPKLWVKSDGPNV